MTIAGNVAAINGQIRSAEQEYKRTAKAVSLLAVSKSQSTDQMIAAILAGQTVFGENYLQEALAKIAALQQYDLEWHYIGAIQANKTRAIAENFAWAHGVSRVKTAERLQQQRPLELPPLNVCLQVNISNEDRKNGVPLVEVPALAAEIAPLDRLHLRGLMAIPAYYPTFIEQKRVYDEVALMQQTLIGQGLALDTLSMGMSHDFKAAIAAGSTMVRIGTAIFGQRI